MNDGGYMNLPAKPTDQTTASIGGAAGRDVTSPADTLRQLLAQEPQTAREWGERQAAIERHVTAHGPSWLALLDAAQDIVDFLNRLGDDGTGPLAAAVRALTEPRP